MSLEQLLEKQVTDLNGKIRSLSYEKENLEKNNNDLRAELEGLMGEIAKAKKTKKAQQDAVDAAKAEIDDHKEKSLITLGEKEASLEEVFNQLKDGQNSLDKDRKDHAKKVNVFEDSKKEIVEKVKKLESSIKESFEEFLKSL